MYQTKNLGLNITEIEKDTLSAFNFDTDLGDNFKAIDEKTLSHRNITNCILEVPQDIKAECSNGTLTIKAGSKIWVPYGTEDKTREYPVGSAFINNNFMVVNTQFNNDKFFVQVEVQENINLSNAGNTASSDFLVFLRLTNNSLTYGGISISYSGSEIPTTGFLYETTENFIKYYEASTNMGSINSLPILNAKRKEGTITSIDQVFNGYGYIGSILFELPGVKGLITEGINDDGTLKAVIKTTSKVAIDPDVGPHSNSIISNLEGDIEATVWLGESDTHPSTEGVVASPRYLNTRTNFIQLDAGITGDWKNQYGYLQVFEDLKVDPTGKILSITPKKPFRAVDHNNYIQKITELETKIATLQAAVEALQGS